MRNKGFTPYSHFLRSSDSGFIIPRSGIQGCPDRKVVSSGFTLLEVLVAIGITAVLMGIGGSTFFNLLKSAAKTEALKEVKQSGDYALSVLDVKIRNARDVSSVCDGSAQTDLRIINPDNTTTVFDCVTLNNTERIRQTTAGVTSYLTGDSVTLGECANLALACTATNEYKTVRINFPLTQTSTQNSPGTATQNFSAQITLRNK